MLALDRLRRRVELLSYAFAADPCATLRGLAWRVRGRKVRGSNAIVGAAARHPGYYRFWIRRVEPAMFQVAEERRNPLRIAVWNCTSVANAELPDFDASMVGDVAAQVGNIAELNTLLNRLQDGEAEALWLLAVNSSDRISAEAHRILAQVHSAHRNARVIFWDEDEIRDGERTNPWLKSRWDKLLYLSKAGLIGASLVRCDAVREALAELPEKAFEGDYGAYTTLVHVAQHLDAGEFVHVPRVLTHRQQLFARPEADAAHRTAVLANWSGLEALVTSDKTAAGQVAAVFALPDRCPTVSVIVPTRDKSDLLRCCLSGIERTRYSGSIEIIVVDNGSVEPEARQILAELPTRGVTVISEPGEFNFSRLNNRAVAAATGDYVCLLNNDVEVEGEDWLEHMMRVAVQPQTGAVGCLLLYPDGTVQHAGVAIGIGGAAGHVYRGLGRDEEGHRWMHRTTRQVSAVTAACMVVRRADYLKVGGMDEAEFKVAFNDVDLCLKLADAGLRNVFVAEAILFHHESKSRGDDASDANRERFAKELAALRRRWNTQVAVDPYHSPLFLRGSETAVLAP